MDEKAVTTAENSVPGRPFTKDDPRINREGRPKGSYSIVELIKKKLQEIPEGKDKTYGEYFVEQIMKKSVIEGDVSMMKDVINRVDGMPKQSVDHTTNGKDIPQPLLTNYVSSNKSYEESNGNEQTPEMCAGRDISQQDNIDSLIPDPQSTERQETNVD